MFAWFRVISDGSARDSKEANGDGAKSGKGDDKDREVSRDKLATSKKDAFDQQTLQVDSYIRPSQDAAQHGHLRGSMFH